MQINYWLIKSEPTVFSIDHLYSEGFTRWDGVRNYQVRNMMRDEMKVCDLALFYHSNAKPSGVAGICRICSGATPDESQWEPNNIYYDKRSTKDSPIWVSIEVEFVEKFPHLVSLNELRKESKLEGMDLLKKGNRLSITPVTQKQFEHICKLGHLTPTQPHSHQSAVNT